MDVPLYQYLREIARSVWEAIFAHPFVTELGTGTLARDRFLFFVRQDYLYLQDFARVLCLVGAKADSLDTLNMFPTMLLQWYVSSVIFIVIGVES